MRFDAIRCSALLVLVEPEYSATSGKVQNVSDQYKFASFMLRIWRRSTESGGKAFYDNRRPVVQGRDLLRATGQIVLRQQRRRHWRFSRPGGQARLPEGSRGRLHLGHALLPFAAQGRRLRYRRFLWRSLRFRYVARRQTLY